MQEEMKECRLCSAAIPAARLRVIPDTTVCVDCSGKIGGEFGLRVTVSGTGKAGSLKITGQEITVKRYRKSVR
jgi:hypothetical protein